MKPTDLMQFGRTLCTSALLSIALVFAQPTQATTYTLTDLGNLSGATATYAYSITNNGWVGCYSGAPAMYNPSVNGGVMTGVAQHFYYNQQHQKVYYYAAGTFSAINSSDWVIWLNGTNGYWLSHNDGTADISLSTFNGGTIYGLNDSGYILGTGGGPILQPDILTPTGTVITLNGHGTLGYAISNVVNSNYYVTGVTSGLDYHFSYPFLSVNGGLISQQSVPIGTQMSRGTCVNAHGEIAGSYEMDSLHGSYQGAFIGGNASFQDIGHIDPMNQPHPYCININKTIVGTEQVNPLGFHGFVYKLSTGIQDLNSIVTAPGWTFISANSVNDSEVIVGTGQYNGAMHAFMLTPH